MACTFFKLYCRHSQIFYTTYIIACHQTHLCLNTHFNLPIFYYVFKSACIVSNKHVNINFLKGAWFM